MVTKYNLVQLTTGRYAVVQKMDLLTFDKRRSLFEVQDMAEKEYLEAQDAYEKYGDVMSKIVRDFAKQERDYWEQMVSIEDDQVSQQIA